MPGQGSARRAPFTVKAARLASHWDITTQGRRSDTDGIAGGF
jgi:hypothetical protein